MLKNIYNEPSYCFFQKKNASLCYHQPFLIYKVYIILFSDYKCSIE